MNREAIKERIEQLEHELATTKYNKRSQGHIGLVKAKIARLKDKLKKGQKKGISSIRKSGDATVAIVGMPSVGKSTLLNTLTGARSKVADYQFTTLNIIPGVLSYNSAKIQLLDMPGVIKGLTSKIREALSYATTSELILILVDKPEQLKVIENELYKINIRLNQTKPDVTITRKIKGGLDISAKRLKLDKETISIILKEYGFINADVVIRENITIDQLIDVLEGNRSYVKGMVILNKIDSLNKNELEAIKNKIKPDICVSAEKKINLEELKKLIFEKLELIRVYCKEVGKKADTKEALILFKDATLRGACLKLHKDFVEKFRFARIWGSSRFAGQKILKLDYKLKDGDVIELHI